MDKTQSKLSQIVLDVITVQLVKGDITKETNVDVIINTIGPNLTPENKLSQDIYNACGKVQMKNACESYLKSKKTKKLNNGDIFISDPYDMKKNGIKKILHIVFPIYSKNQNEMFNCKILENCMYSILQETFQQMNYQKLSVPLMGSGAAGFPIPMCFEAYLNTILDFDYVLKNSGQKKKYIRFVIMDDQTLNQFSKECEKIQTKYGKKNSLDDIDHKQQISSDIQILSDADQERLKDSRQKKEELYLELSKIDLHIINGNLSDIFDKDAIIRDVYRHDLNDESIQVLKASGNEKERQNIQNFIDIFCPKFENGRNGEFSKFRKLILRILWTAFFTNQFQSIAIPLIGYDKEYSKDEVSSIFIDSILEFDEHLKNLDIIEINILVDNQEVFEEFKKQYNYVEQNLNFFRIINQSRFNPELFKMIGCEDKSIVQDEQINLNMVIEEMPIQVGTLNPKPMWIQPLNKIKLEILKGNIVKENNCDAIVNAANTGLKSGDGVCGVIFNACGKKNLQQECLSYFTKTKTNKVMTGNAIITSACELKQVGIKHVIHAVGPIYSKYQHKQSEDDLEKCIDSILKLAFIEHKLNSISLPAISSGVYDFPLDKCTQIIIRTIIRFDIDYNNKLLGNKLIRLIDINEQALNLYINHLKIHKTQQEEQLRLNVKHQRDNQIQEQQALDQDSEKQQDLSQNKPINVQEENKMVCQEQYQKQIANQFEQFQVSQDHLANNEKSPEQSEIILINNKDKVEQDFQAEINSEINNDEKRHHSGESQQIIDDNQNNNQDNDSKVPKQCNQENQNYHFESNTFEQELVETIEKNDDNYIEKE